VKVRGAVDSDETLQVKLHFRQISDKVRQKACLLELQQIVEGVDRK